MVHSHARLRQKTNRQQEQSDRNEMIHLVASGDNAVPLLQREFHQLADRISQVAFALCCCFLHGYHPVVTRYTHQQFAYLNLQCCQLFHGLQVLEHTVAPVLSAFATARDTQQSQMLNPLRLPDVDAQCQERLHLSAPAAIRGLQLLPKLQDWAMFGVLICPGISRI